MITDSCPEPFDLFRIWYQDAHASGNPDADAVVLATATPDGLPAARMVLLKAFDERGFVFFTNYESRKGRELADNPRAALLFWWKAPWRQVRMEGRAARLSGAESDAYFASRSRGSQIGAWASKQSLEIPDREALMVRVRAFEARFAGSDVPRPPHWGGFRVVPDRVEFFEGGADRLHDRLLYERLGSGDWRICRLAP